MGNKLKNFLYNKYFLFGLLLKIYFIFSITPEIISNFYIPFFEYNLNKHNFLDPWTAWVANKGDIAAFPYGYITWLIFIPFIMFAKIMSIPIDIMYGLIILLVDFILLVVLKKIIEEKYKTIFIFYWLSPLIILPTYVLGYNDLVPVMFLFLSLYYIKNNKVFSSGVLIIAAISAKLSMILALPFFIIYLINNKIYRKLFISFLKGCIVGIALLIVPFFFLSQLGPSMLFSNATVDSIYYLSLNINDGFNIYIIPLIYFFMLFTIWQIRRINFELFCASLSISFLLVALLTLTSPGWFIWSIFLFVTYQIRGGALTVYLCSGFFAIFIISSILMTSSDVTSHMISTTLNINEDGFLFFSYNKLITIINTLLISIGLLLILSMWRRTIRENDFFRLSRKPFVMGISGDSGSGKDTFAESILNLFGENSVTSISGDDYHFWDRKKPMWKVITHLNPMANNLEAFANDLIKLSDGKSILSSHYDHNTGLKSIPKKIKSNDFIIASGLHALYLPILRDCYNLSIFLDMDEELRKYLKIDRDIKTRGHNYEKVIESIEKREPDANRFIRPQANYADLIISLKPMNPDILRDKNLQKDDISFRISIESKLGLNELSLTRALISICGINVDIEKKDHSSLSVLTIEGNPSAEDIEVTAKILAPRIFEFLAINPKWLGGISGIMQLISIAHIDQALTKRFL